ncbi:hypothetical protein Tco_1578849, partial [Tanacetum coccineum]
MITTVFAATTPENMSSAYRASSSTNSNPMISPAFMEENYEGERWNYDMSPTMKLLQPFVQGLLWSTDNKKELWDLRKHRTKEEAGEEGTPK